MTHQDLWSAIDSAIGAFAAIMVVETVIKPVAIFVGKRLLKSADDRVKWLPDFLYKDPGKSE